MQPSKGKLAARCGHYEQVKVRGKWKCVACGQILTIAESMQNSIELSGVIMSTIVTGRPLGESLDDLLGRKEWDAILAKIPSRGKLPKRRIKQNIRKTFTSSRK